METTYVICAIAMLIPIGLIVAMILNHKNDTAFSNETDDYIKKNGITCTRDLVFMGAHDRCRFIADDVNKVIYISSQATGDNFTKIPYREIMGVSIRQQNVDTETIGAAIFASNYGPIPRTTFVENYSVVISTRDIQRPQIILPLIQNARVRFESEEYNNAVHFAEEMQAIVRVIQSRSIFDSYDFDRPYWNG